MNHKKCLLKFRRHLTAYMGDVDFANLIIVDNTNIRLDEMEKYMDDAWRADVEYYSFRFKCRIIEEAAMQCLRSLHSVPLHVAFTRYDEYIQFLDPEHEEEVIPRYDDRDFYRLVRYIPDLEQ